MTGVRFQLEASGTLMLVYESGSAVATPLDVAALQQELAEQGFGELFVDQEALATCAERMASLQESFRAPVGERRDASYSLTVADDLMSVWLTLVPACGGKAVGAEVSDELRERGIVFGLFNSRLQAALIAGECESLLIAQGQAAEDGVPARFESLLPDVKERRPQVNKQGIVDYRNLGQILIVHPQDPLLRRIPAIPGKSGTNVRGEVVLARSMPATGFSPECSGTCPAADDPDLLLSSIVGQPVLIDNGVLVNPIIEVEAVDLHSGNISFEGTVKVLGDVKSGMRVEASGDVFIAGMIEAAEIVAKGDVVIKGGVVGQLSLRGNGEGLTSNARIVAHGSVSALFMENAEVRTQQSILISDYANQCLLMAHDEIVVGKPGGRRGSLIGGHANAMQKLKVEVLGSPSGVQTRVQVGIDPYSFELQQGLQKKIRSLEGELLRIDQLLAFFVLHPEKGVGGLLEKTQRSLEHKRAELDRHVADLERLIADDEMALQARVEARRLIHGGVEIRIGVRCWQVVEDHGACTLMLRDNEIASV